MSRCIVFFLLLRSFEECRSVVLKGKRLQEGQFPWLIQFQTITPCGGVLVSPDWILTAAQCVQDKRSSIILYAAGLNGTGSKQEINVKATYIFTRYQPYSTIPDRDNNIALLKLTQSFDICDNQVMLIDIAPVRLDDDYKSCFIFGWQSYVSPSHKVLAKPIQYSDVILNSWKICTYMLEGNINYTNVFCTMVEFENGMKACAGNPGSPVVCEDQRQRMILVGIASWTNFSLNCDGLPTYLGVSAFRAWIYDLIFNDKRAEEWSTNKKSGTGMCRTKQHLPSPNTNTLQNHTNFMGRTQQLNNLFEDILQNPKPEQSKATFDDVLRQYQEIGQSKDSNSNIDEIIANPAEHKKFTHTGGYPDNYPTSQTDTADDLELLDLNFEDITKSHSNILIHPKVLTTLYVIFILSLYFTVHTT